MLKWCWLVVSALMLVGGCRQGPPRAEAPDWDPQQIAARAIEQLDTNGDSTIDPEEAKAAPGLSAAFDRVDTNQDGRLAEEEIQARFDFYEKLRTALVSRSFQVLLNGRPLANAKVEFVPEEYQQDAIEAASGVTDYEGMVTPQTMGQDKPAMRIGFYRVKAYVPGDGEGQEVSARSPVGIEVSPVSEPDESGTPVLRFET